MKESSEKLATIIETFDLLGGWEERYRYLIDLGRALPPMAEAEKTEATQVQGCTAQVWMAAAVSPDGLFHLRAESDAHIVRGLVAILYAACDGRPAEEVATRDFDGLFKRLDLAQNLSPNRRNGFYAMVDRIKTLSAAAQRN